MVSAKWWPLCLSLNVLADTNNAQHTNMQKNNHAP